MGGGKEIVAKKTGKDIAKERGIDVQHSLYRKTGDWYHILNTFPAALLDESGYIKFETQEDYDLFIRQSQDAGINQNLETNTLTLRDGIAAHGRYTPFVQLFPNEISNSTPVVEGAKRQVIVNSYERDASARKLCLHKWGVNCSVCNLNFEKVYGKIGNGFVHVHHLTPISSIKEEYVLVPERDMRPVCPNCHAMLHQRDPPFLIEELRDIINKNADI
jgi:HNH endonuclease